MHSNDTIGTNSTEYNLTYGRDVTGLDVLAFAHNDFNITTERWKATVDLIRQIMAKMPNEGPVMATLPNVLHWKIPHGETYIRGECSRGEYGFYVVTDGSHAGKLRIGVTRSAT